jgi:tol-pal system protein YbgF
VRRPHALARLAPLALAVLLAALFNAACAGGVLPPRGPADDTEMRELKSRMLELQRQTAVQKVELARLRERIAELEARAGGTAGARPAPARTGAGAAPADRSAAARPAPARREEPTAGAEPRFEIAEVLEDEEIDPDDLEAAPVPPGRAQPASGREQPAAPPAPPPTTPAPTAGATRPPSPAAQALYDQGYTLFHQGRFIDAESAFRRFLQEHPDNDHADNAQYWIGEARYARDDLRGALAAFRETVERYPQGNKVPDALLKAGQCLERLSDREGARETYREVVRRFPESAAAVVAAERASAL